MANIRTFYACQSLAARGPSGSDGDAVAGNFKTTSYEAIEGISTLGMTTNYNLEPIYQIGRLAPADLYENNPEVELSITQTLSEGTNLIQYMMGTGTLNSLSDARGGLLLSIFPETVASGAGNRLASIEIEPAYIQSLSLNFSTDAPFTADYTVVGNSKVYEQHNLGSPFNSTPRETLTGIVRRQSMFGPGPAATNSKFTNYNGKGGALPSGSKVQNITVSVDLGREEIYEMGKVLPFARYINFPVEVTTEFEVIVASGDMAEIKLPESTSCTDLVPRNITPQPIEFRLCDSRGESFDRYDLGNKNYLQSVTQAGGDGGGGNVTYTYSYINYSDFGFVNEDYGIIESFDMEKVDFEKYDSLGYKK